MEFLEVRREREEDEWDLFGVGRSISEPELWESNSS